MSTDETIPLEFTLYHNGRCIAGGFTTTTRIGKNSVQIVHLPTRIAHQQMIRVQLDFGDGEFAPGWYPARVRLDDHNGTPMTMVWNALIFTVPAPFPTVVVMPSIDPGMPGAFALVLQRPERLPPALTPGQLGLQRLKEKHEAGEAR